MPFLHTLKASLVAMVLIALTAVPRLDAAPMENFEPWMREVIDIGKKAVRSDFNTEAFGASPASAFHLVQPGEQLQGVPATPQPFGNQPWSTDGLPPWSTFSNPSGPSSPHPVFRPNANYPSGIAGPGYGTAVRNEVGQPSTSDSSPVTIALDAATRKDAFGRTPVEEEPWSNEDILEILKGDQWKGLSRNNKAAYLNSFGDKVFTLDFYNRLFALDGKKNWRIVDKNDRLTQELVKEYIKVRLEDRVGPLQIGFQDNARPQANTFFTNPGRLLGDKVPSTSATEESNSDDPYRPFRLGIFSIKLSSDQAGYNAEKIWNNLKRDKWIPLVNVTARKDGPQKVYIGKAEIKRAK